MLEARRALDLALDLAHMPSLAGAMREQPLPSDILILIRVAAGCEEALRQAAMITGAQPGAIKEAAVFYLQQVMFSGVEDSYRILGVAPGASRSEMREHMRWLMNWLHPDHNHGAWESVFAEKVLKAWREVSSRRSRTDVQIRPKQVEKTRRGRTKFAPRWIALPVQPPVRTWDSRNARTVTFPLPVQPPVRTWDSRNARTVTFLLAGLIALTILGPLTWLLVFL